jgi:hypothetical protein
MATSPDPSVRRRRAASAAAGLLAATAATAVLSAGAAGAPPAASPPVSFVRNGGGKSFVVAHGQPYLMYGVQLRIDHIVGDGYPAALSQKRRTVIAQYFQRAKGLNFRSVAVPVRWCYLEPVEGQYDFSYLDMVIDDARANGLDVQLLWYGADVCGWNLAPAYVTGDRARFPRNPRLDVFLDLSSPNLIAREKAAVAAMMAHIASYDTTNRVVMVQVENEPDGAGPLTKDLKWGDAGDMTAKMFAGGQFSGAVALMDTIGRVIHAGPRRVVTRCNIGTTYRALDVYTARPAAHPGVDIYGVDTYSLDPVVTKKALNTLPGTGGNVLHQPEGGGKAGNLINLTLSDFEEGGGSLIYELRSLEGDNGIYRKPAGDDDWTERDGTLLLWNKKPENKTSQIRAFNALVYKADREIAVAAKGDCAAFNVDDHPGVWTETRTVGGKPLTYRTWDGSPAFALRDRRGGLVLMSLTDGNVFTVDPSCVRGRDASVGYFDASDRWHEQYRKPFKGRTLLMWKGEVVRLPPAPTFVAK